MKITHFSADCFSHPGLYHSLFILFLFIFFFSARWKENWMRRVPFSNPIGPCLVLAVDKGRETISQNGSWVWRWWHHCTPPRLGNQRNVLSPPGCLPRYQRATASWSQEVRCWTGREKDDSDDMSAVKFPAKWLARWVIQSLSCILSSPHCWKEFQKGIIFSVLPSYSKCIWEP